MKPHIFPVHEAKTRFSELLRMVEAGETILITRHGKTIAQLGLPKIEPTRRLGVLAEEWKDYDLEKIEAALIGEDPEIVALFEGEEENEADEPSERKTGS